jgi:hypothetical protein
MADIKLANIVDRPTTIAKYNLADLSIKGWIAD